MHCDYSEKYILDERSSWPSEKKAGEIVVKSLLKGHKGHYGPLEHPSIVFATGGFPHSVMQQARTHRIASFDVQSFRYTGNRLIQAAKHLIPLEDVIYLRPAGHYSDRQGNKYFYHEELRRDDLEKAEFFLENYRARIEENGLAPEHARSLIPFDTRQNFVFSFNMRSLMHFLTIRSKNDAQWEIRQLCEMMLPIFQEWSPEVANWFKENLWKKGRLAP